jgi:hypothetical protein
MTIPSGSALVVGSMDRTTPREGGQGGYIIVEGPHGPGIGGPIRKQGIR